jgi:DNA (cytosine-5)-methyltransferase 1
LTLDAAPVVLETFACEGGGTAGWLRRGFTVYAVDLDRNRLKRNPARYHRVDDALEVLHRLANGDHVGFRDTWTGLIVTLHKSMIRVHASSPPCQGYTRGNAGRVTSWPQLIYPVREASYLLGVPFVIENVSDARPHMMNPVALCGCQFDLTTTDDDGTKLHLKRERLFETHGFTLTPPRPCDHTTPRQWAGVYGGARRDKHEARHVRKGGYVPPSRVVCADLLGITHAMTWRGLTECLPPAYTDHIAGAVLDAT